MFSIHTTHLQFVRDDSDEIIYGIKCHICEENTFEIG